MTLSFVQNLREYILFPQMTIFKKLNCFSAAKTIASLGNS